MLRRRLFPKASTTAAPAPAPSPPVADDDELSLLEELNGVGVGQSQSCLSTMEVQLLGSDRQWRTGRVEGLSPTDVLADFSEPVLLGELVAVRLLSPLHHITTDSLGIVHWRQRYLGRYLTGLFLREPLPDLLLSKYWMDTRRELRFPANKPVQASCGTDGALVPVTITNYSHSGVSVVAESRPQVGQPIEFYDEDLLATGRVQYVRPDARGRGYQFGCALRHLEGLQLARVIQIHEAGGYEFWLQAPDPSSDFPGDDACLSIVPSAPFQMA